MCACVRACVRVRVRAQFYATEPEHAGAKCHKLIMFFSDGGVEEPGHVIAKYKNITETEVRARNGA